MPPKRILPLRPYVFRFANAFVDFGGYHYNRKSETFQIDDRPARLYKDAKRKMADFGIIVDPAWAAPKGSYYWLADMMTDYQLLYCDRYGQGHAPGIFGNDLDMVATVRPADSRNSISDLKRVVGYARDELGWKRIAIWGHSLGARDACVFNREQEGVEVVARVAVEAPNYLMEPTIFSAQPNIMHIVGAFDPLCPPLLPHGPDWIYELGPAPAANVRLAMEHLEPIKNFDLFRQKRNIFKFSKAWIDYRLGANKKQAEKVLSGLDSNIWEGVLSVRWKERRGAKKRAATRKIGTETGREEQAVHRLLQQSPSSPFSKGAAAAAATA